jgi:hypothetical protein
MMINKTVHILQSSDNHLEVFVHFLQHTGGGEVLNTLKFNIVQSYMLQITNYYCENDHTFLAARPDVQN